MEIVFVIVGIVAVVSLYDYISAKSWQQINSSVRNELVFRNRNKDYGAYVLRRDYDKRMLGIMFGVVCSIGLMSSTYIYLKRMPVAEIKPQEVQIDYFIPDFKREDDKIEPPIQQEEIQEAGGENTTEFREPIVTDDDIETSQLLSQEELDKLKAGSSKTIFTDEGGWGDPGEGDGQETTIIEKDKDFDLPTIEVDEEAKFNGSLPSFIQGKLIYPQIAIENNIKGKCYLKFVINRDGSVEQVSIERGVPDCPECDQEAKRVIKSMPNWVPAKVKGKPVRAYMLLPINFELN